MAKGEDQKAIVESMSSKKIAKLARSCVRELAERASSDGRFHEARELLHAAMVIERASPVIMN